MAKVSVIIPSNKERFLPQTIADVFAKAKGEIEVIAVLDGYWPDPPLEERDGLIILHRGESKGMRDAINSAAAIATGEFLCKCDAHCMFAEGFDDVLKADCDGDWVVIPRRYSLDAEAWAILDNGKAPVDYHYLSWPYVKPDEIGMHGTVWNERARERKDILLDDEMSSQGSCWFMSKRHFTEFLGGLSEEGYGTFVQEFQEIGLKTWLGGGAVKINKRTWYAHLHKGKTYGRGYFISKGEMIRGTLYAADYWMNNRWEKRVHDIEWLIDKFWPVPTWPGHPGEWRVGHAVVAQGHGAHVPGAAIRQAAPGAGNGGNVLHEHAGDPVGPGCPADQEGGGVSPRDHRSPELSPGVGVAAPQAERPVRRTLSGVAGQQPEDTLARIVDLFGIDMAAHKHMPIEIPNTNRDVLATLFAELGFTRGAEIGVEQGEYSEVLCKANPQLEALYCVDAWKHYDGYRDHVNQKKLDGFYEKTKARLAPWSYVRLIRAFSVPTAEAFLSGNGSFPPLDFVYIDAAHDLVSVVNDLHAWSKVVRPGGIIAGHDYCRTKNDFALHVMEATHAFTSAYRIRPWFVLGSKDVKPGELRDKRRSFMWVKP